MEPSPGFSRQEAFGYGWQMMKKHFWLFTGLLVLIGIIQGIENYFSDDKFHGSPVSALITMIFWVLDVIVQIGFLKVLLNLHDGKGFKFSDLFSQWRLFFKYIFGAIVYGLIVLAGLILLIVPGIMWAVRFQLYTYFIVDKKAGPIEALKLSAQATKGSRTELFWFDLACFGAAILGLLALFVGLLAAIPTILMAMVFVYRKLQPQAPAGEPAAPAVMI
ncbi:MAG: hypothetical protein WC732_07250 [Candidatus Omnitrophota bacterium]